MTETGEIHPIPTLDEVRSFKPWSRLAYNFVATPRGGEFERRLQQARLE